MTSAINSLEMHANEDLDKDGDVNDGKAQTKAGRKRGYENLKIAFNKFDAVCRPAATHIHGPTRLAARIARDGRTAAGIWTRTNLLRSCAASSTAARRWTRTR